MFATPALQFRTESRTIVKPRSPVGYHWRNLGVFIEFIGRLEAFDNHGKYTFLVFISKRLQKQKERRKIIVS